MSMSHRPRLIATLALGVALAAAFPACHQLGPSRNTSAAGPGAVFAGPRADLPAVPAATIKAAFPDASVRAAIANKDLGFPVYVVQLAGDKTASAAEVTPDGTLVWSRLQLTPADLPAPVATAAATDGYVVESAAKVTTTADCKFNGPKLAKLAAPVTTYEIILHKASQRAVITLAPDGTIVTPLTPIVRASAIVRPDKFVLRVNCGSRIPYTDNSGITWAADQKYTAGKTTWGFIGQFDLTAQRTGLHVLGTDAPGVYDCERYKMGAYHFDVPNGTYTVRIHNNESWEGAKTPGVRVWGVKINGKVATGPIDIAKEAGFLKPIVHEIKDVQVTDGKLIVEPYPVRTDNDQHPFIDAYEIIGQ